MPIYEYRCPDCGVRYEKIVPNSKAATPPCPSCQGTRGEKLISAPGGVGVFSGSPAQACSGPTASGACPRAPASAEQAERGAVSPWGI